MSSPTKDNKDSLVVPITQHFDISSDYKRYIPGEGSGKEYLKTEIEKMLGILRKKHEIGQGIHLFKKLDAKGQKEQG